MNGTIKPVSTARTFWHLLCFQPWSYLLVLSTKLCFITLLPQATALLMRQFFDRLNGQGAMTWSVQTIVWLLVGIGLARTVTVVVDIVGNRVFRHPLGVLLRKNVLAYLFAQPAAQALIVSPGEAISHLRDDPTTIANFLYETTFLVSQLLFALIALSVMVSINPWIAALVFGPLVVVILVANRMRKRIERLSRLSRTTTDAIIECIGEIFGGIEAVQVATAEPEVIERFRRLNADRRAAMLQSRLLHGLLETFFRNIPALGTGLIMLVAVQAMRTGSFTIGDFVLFAFYLGSLNETVFVIGLTATEYRHATVALQRLIALTKAAPPAALVEHGPIYQRGAAFVVTHPQKVAADRLEVLTVEGLSYGYPGSGRGIQNVSLQLQRGTVTVITGEVGAGKTTLLKILLGLLPRGGGTIHWNGLAVTDPATFFVPPRVAYVAQIPSLFSDSVLDNILLGLPEAQVDLQQAVHAAVLEPDLAQLSDGLATCIGPRGKTIRWPTAAGGCGDVSAQPRIVAL
ncbi:MAG: ABC transporter ATP-binding protein [Caldilineaceae bacterium]